MYVFQHGLRGGGARAHLKISQLITEPTEAKSVATVINGAKTHLKE